MTTPKRRHTGFSLLELLVVIGIIALLLTILLPVLTRMRESARQVKCLANLTAIFAAAQGHENDHHGFLPAGGWHWDPAGGIVDPRGLGDSQAARYIYYDDNGIKRPVPVTVALAISLGAHVRLDSRQILEQDMQSQAVRKYFLCPSQGEQLQGITQKSSEPWEAPREWSSYVFNEAVLGLREKSTTPDSVLGKALRVRRPSSVFFVMDGRPRDQDRDNWLMVANKTKQDTLWDFQQMVSAPNTGYGKQLLDFRRHRSSANVLFMDGHVENVPMTQSGLKAVGVSRGVYD